MLSDSNVMVFLLRLKKQNNMDLLTFLDKMPRFINDIGHFKPFIIKAGVRCVQDMSDADLRYSLEIDTMSG